MVEHSLKIFASEEKATTTHSWSAVMKAVILEQRYASTSS